MNTDSGFAEHIAISKTHLFHVHIYDYDKLLV